ncbi:lebercilin [Eublepharis macularius]|uniref:Lebercilin n=1 Tax=Eublepharis macularius TaxID=481883 RepID=A0AA97JQY5_EUBMA|nr:lebercilin [Eublepharis macularius]
MEEGGRSLDSGHNQKSESDKSSNSYYSYDDDSSCSSDCSATGSAQSTNTEGKNHKAQNLKTFAHYQASKQIAGKYAPSKKGMRCGFRSQSFNRDSSDISLITKRVLSARLLKINELHNELAELHVKVDELQKENRTLKQLQYRHEKALHKFEDTENEISQLLARHNNEIRILRERLRKSQEREQTAERKLKTSEEELYKVKSTLQKLRRLAEDRHLPERDELAKKLASAESRLDDNEKRIKELEKNLDLSNHSFQRQLHSEKKKLYEAQEEKKTLQEEIQQLSQKLKDKERELDVKNIYANRKLKPSPKKDMNITPRKKGVGKNTKGEEQTTKGVQTSGYFSPVEFPPPPAFLSESVSEEKKENVHLRTKEETVKEDWKEQTDHFSQEEIREEEKRLKNDQELQVLEEAAKKVRDEWKGEESERRKKENSLLLKKEKKRNILETEIYSLENEMQNSKSAEERRRKEMLLTKMHEMDKEAQININLASHTSTSDTIATYSLEKSKRPFQFPETADKIFNGFPDYDQHNGVTKGEIQNQHNVGATDSSSDLIFGSYVPSFAKGSRRPNWLNQKTDVLEDTAKENVGLNIKRDKKTNLMEQLFGSSANAITSSKANDFDFFVQGSSTDSFPQDKGTTGKVKDESDVFFSEGKSFNPKRHRLQHMASRSSVKAVNYSEDEIEEVLLH